MSSTMKKSTCLARIAEVRWENGIVVCPYCDAENCSTSGSRWHCNTCNTSFGVTTGTIFHNARSPQQIWRTIELEFGDDTQRSAAELGAALGVSRQRAWRLRKLIEKTGWQNESLIRKIAGLGAGDELPLPTTTATEPSSPSAQARSTRATHVGELKIGDMVIPCAVLKDGTRVVSQRGFYRGLGGGNPSPRDNDGDLPAFLQAKNLRPFIPVDLAATLAAPVCYKPHKGGSVAHGIEARLIPEICDVWLAARDAGILHHTQIAIARAAEILMRGLARVGIVALVDEVTGYQAERDKDELSKILEAYIAKELLPWTKRFPDEFYREMFRLKEWTYSPLSIKRPRLVGRYTAELVYDRLPDGVVDELRSKNPMTPKGYRKHKHHQFLTDDVGHGHLEKHLAGTIALMRASPNWSAFKRLFERAYPKGPVQCDLVDGLDDSSPDEG